MEEIFNTTINRLAKTFVEHYIHNLSTIGYDKNDMIEMFNKFSDEQKLGMCLPKVKTEICSQIMRNGKPCEHYSINNTKFCSKHQEKIICKSIIKNGKNAGQRCKTKVVNGSLFCHVHRQRIS